MELCPHLAKVIKLAESEGNKLFSVSSSELMDKVLWMNNQLSSELRDKIMLDKENLIYTKEKDMPHNPGTENFVCEECKTVVVFPLRTAK